MFKDDRSTNPMNSGLFRYVFDPGKVRICSMSSFFSYPEHVRAFSTGFDLVKGQLSDSVIVEILEEIVEVWEDEPDDRDVILAIEALNDAIDEPYDALDALFLYTELTEHSVYLLRKAWQLRLSGENEKAETALRNVILNGPPGGQLIKQICACIAYGRLDDEDSFNSQWDLLIKQSPLRGRVPAARLIENPGHYTILENLPYREHIEGIRYLFQYNITTGRETEIFALFCSFQNYLEYLMEITLDIGVTDGFIECLYPLSVIPAISSGCITVAEEILGKEGAVTTRPVRDAIDQYLGEIRKFGIETRVLDTLTRWCFTRRQPLPELLRILREQSGGDDELIAEMVDFLAADLKPVIVDGLISSLSLGEGGPDGVRKRKRGMNSMPDDHHPAFPDVSPQVRRAEQAHTHLTLAELISAGKEKAFFYLLGLIQNGDIPDLGLRLELFRIACSPAQIDELVRIKSIFEAERVLESVYLLNAFDRMRNGDVKAGLALVERAKGAGVPEEMAMLLAARFLLITGYPKRVVGLCEKMIRRAVSPGDVYPLLIQAYHDLGREGEAGETETVFKLLLKVPPANQSTVLHDEFPDI